VTRIIIYKRKAFTAVFLNLKGGQMNIILVFYLAAQPVKSVEVKTVALGPVIDGVIEELWSQADSACNFIQVSPYEMESPAEKTVVYVLQDADNLYFAFKCYAEKYRAVSNLTREEDNVAVGIDPFGTQTTGYYFLVNASGIRDDGWILDGGQTMDDSWDGVWYQTTKIYDSYYTVEIKIPFKSIRYKKGLKVWGLQFRRFIAGNREEDLWTEATMLESQLISNWGLLKGINPQTTGYYFEFYSEGYIRIDRSWHETSQGYKDSLKTKPSVSLSAKWDITPQTTFNATVYPDFAQIESDPYTLNLGRYPTYLDEKRPFFLEGKDIFRMSTFGEGKGFFTPLEIFYSRKLGKSMDGDAVPIIAGAKLTNKTETWNIGGLAVYTDKFEEDSLIEQRRGYGVIRLRRRISESSDIGMLLDGTAVDEDDYNVALGVDGVVRKGINQFIIQTAVSERNQKRGWAVSSGFFGLLGGDYLTISGITVVNDSFDVGDIGFVPWAGQKQLIFLCGPFKQYKTGPLANLYFAPGFFLTQEPGSNDWSKVALLEINPNTRNQWGCDLSLYLGPYYEADTNFLHRGFNLSVWGNLFQQHINFGCEYSYSYNYRRDWLAYHGSNWFSYNYSLFQQLSVGLSGNVWMEWDTHNALTALTPRLRPNVLIRFNPDMKLTFFTELVMTTPGTSFEEAELVSVRSGALFSWNYLPKSWLYIALNDYHLQDSAGDLQPQYQVWAIKAKHLFYF